MPRRGRHRGRRGDGSIVLVGGRYQARYSSTEGGHADPALTARVYSHVAPQTTADAVGVLDEAVK